jgi:hypothetical protein
VLAGLPLAHWYAQDEVLSEALLLATTELTTDEDIGRLVTALREATA